MGQRGQVVIPREMLKTLNIKEGDFVAFSKHADGVLIQTKRVVDPQDVPTPAEAKRVRHGMKQIREGRFKLWHDGKHELGC